MRRYEKIFAASPVMTQGNIDFGARAGTARLLIRCTHVAIYMISACTDLRKAAFNLQASHCGITVSI